MEEAKEALEDQRLESNSGVVVEDALLQDEQAESKVGEEAEAVGDEVANALGVGKDTMVAAAAEDAAREVQRPPHRLRDDGLAQTVGSSRSNLAAA